MALPNGYLKDLQNTLGDHRVAKYLFDTLNDLGADGSGLFTTVAADTSITVDPNQTASPAASLTIGDTGGDYIQFGVSNTLSTSGITFSSTGGSGIDFASSVTDKDYISITGNRAIALKIHDGVGNLIVFDTTTGDRVITLGGGVADDSIQVGGVATNKVGFFATTPVVQEAHIADSTDLATSITAISAIIDSLKAYGLLAPDP